MEDNKEHPRVLIEEWFPFEEVGIECRRERGVVSAMPAINYLHVWWARRPLIASKAAILGSILKNDFSRNDFLKIMKFEDNLKSIHKKMMFIKKQGKRSQLGYKKKRAFSQNINLSELEKINNNLIFDDLILMDPMAGGGSIPFEAIRLKIETIASELNPVASIILYGSLYFPIIYGLEFSDEILKYGMKINDRLKKKLKKYFFWRDNQTNFQYIWIRTIICPNPKCSLQVPLAPNWDLMRVPKKKIILKLHFSSTNYNEKSVKFEIVNNPSSEIVKKNPPTVSRGKGKCPRCGEPLTGDYIKEEARSGRMGHRLAAIAYKTNNSKEGVKFRTPNKSDFDGVNKIKEDLKQNWDIWLKDDLIPIELFPRGCDNRPINYGMEYWYKFFNDRQLFVNISILEEIRKLKIKLQKENSFTKEKIRALITYLQIALDKIIDYNSISTMWSSTTLRIAHTFARHDFSFKWSYAEIDVISKGYDWAIKNVVKAYKGLVKLAGNSTKLPKIYNYAAQNIKSIKDGEIKTIIVDPPYYNNVMYAELSDFFYVWMKRNLKDLFPDIFNLELTDKDKEAVANPSRFEDMGKSKSTLAKNDYEAKMKLSFKEMYRILSYHGVLTIMFTHKSTDAWDTLAMSLMDAGFEITASWPVHTEAELSLHIAKKNAVKTTIFLVCRKRIKKQEELWWEDDVLPSIKNIVSVKVGEFRALGIEGVDLFIACFGPALKEFSKSYPVRSISGDLIRAEEAIEAARRVVINFTLQDIIKGKSYNIDHVSKFYLTAWHFFKARSFPFDEARRLALSIGINIDDLKTNHKLLRKKSGEVELLLPRDREKRRTKVKRKFNGSN